MRAEARPPALSLRLLDWAARRLGTPDLVGDADELFVERALRDGEASARRWYRRQTRATVWRALLPAWGDAGPPARDGGRRTSAASRFDGLFQDLRFAFRSLRRRPGFSAAAIATAALGIGVNTAVFSVVDAVLLRPLPYAEADRLLHVWPERFLAQREIEFLRENARTMTAVGSFSPGWLTGLTGVAEPVQLTMARVSGNFFELLGVRPALGHPFGMEAERGGEDAVVVLAWATWQTRFGGDAQIIGRSIQLDGAPFRVLGVMPRGFQFMDNQTELWAPLTMDASAQSYAGSITQGLARLAPGATHAAATAELTALAARMRAGFGLTESYGADARVVSLRESIVGGVRPMMIVLLITVGLVLLIATVNVANLLLVRGTDRQTELALRASLGASRARIARQLLTESAAIGLAAGLIGALAALIGVSLLEGALPPDTPRLHEITLDARMLGLAFMLTGTATLLFGALPALVGARGSLDGWLRAGRTSSGGGSRARAALVAGEVALSVVLLSGAGLMLRTMQSLNAVDPGFRSDNVLTLRLQGSVRDTLGQRAAWRVLRERVASVPGVRAVGSVLHLPMSGRKWQADVMVEGREQPPGTDPQRTAWQVVSGDYFEIVGVPLLHGRYIGDQDRSGAAPAMVVNDAFARAVFPGEDPIGRRVQAGNATRGGWFTIVGVVGSIRHDSLTVDAPLEVFVPFEQARIGANTLVLRTEGDPMALVPAIKAALWEVDPDMPISQVEALDQVVTRSTAARRLVLTLLSAFAAVGVALGSVGIWGVVAYGVRLRTREIGIRLAIGAAPGATVRLAMRQGALPALAGVAAGMLAALGLARFLRGFLFGVAPFDPATFVSVPAALVCITLLACWLPARRAARLDVSNVLRG
jgi:putative ABC transport system permease protein